MPPLFILTVLAQGICLIHAVRNSNNNWIWIIVVLPGLGCAAYALSHIMPELFGSYGIRSSARKVMKHFDPERDRRKLAQNLDRADTVDNKRHLAAESLALKDFEKAKSLYEQCLAGIYERDPDLMLGLAQAQSGLGQHEQVRRTLEDLIAFNPEFRSPHGHLLYAQTLVAMHEPERALNEFNVVKDNFPGEEARYGFAELLIKLGKTERAKVALEELVKRVQLAPAHYQKAQAAWLQKANAALKAL
jgi:hypothetical protein